MRSARSALAWTAWIFGSGEGPAPSGAPPEDLVESLRDWRLAPEAAASPRIEVLPSSARRTLAIERARCEAAAKSRRHCVARLGDALSGAGLVAVLYKGEALVRLTHADPSRREMVDIDAIVSPEERAPVRRALLEAGFEGRGGDTPLHDVLIDASSAGPGHPRGVAVEIHSDVFPPPHPFALQLARVRARSQPTEVSGLLVPRVEDALVLTAFHVLAYELDPSKLLLELRDVALLAERLDARGLRAARDEAERRQLGGVLDEVARRAVRLAGAPEAMATSEAGAVRDGATGGGATSELRGPRRLGVALAARELDRRVGARRGEAPRAATRHLLAALWTARWPAAVLALARGGLGRPGRVRRAARHLAGLAWPGARVEPPS